MARGDKPYRVYRGGRVKGRVPSIPKPDPWDEDGHRDGHAPRVPRTRRRWRIGWGKGIALAVGVLVLLFVVWAGSSFLVLRGGVSAANDRLDAGVRAVLAPQDGLLVSNPTTILLLGTDHADTESRAGARRSDSIMLVRTDPDRHRLAYLSIPRDLRVNVPGHGPSKVNAAFQLGGPALAVRTVRALTGIAVNHVAIVDFGAFEDLIDAVGGVTIDVPRPILSNRFDCPYATQARCAEWPGWRFEKGKQEMDGRRALVYSRIRENRLEPSETDIERGERQQAVLRAITGKLVGAGTIWKLPFVGGDLLEPLATDLTTWEFSQLGWLKFRAASSRELHCRLGGEPATVGGQAVLLSTEDNVATISMFSGASAPQPPRDTFGSGCFVGSARLG
jgi:LCP family protein required for cell wall assembly